MQAFIVYNHTLDGIKFRPSDWVDRIASINATFDKKRLIFNSHLMPAFYGGKYCLYFDEELDPVIFEFVENFVKRNRLVLILLN